jgi:SAM-dependent methyltransferase
LRDVQKLRVATCRKCGVPLSGVKIDFEQNMLFLMVCRNCGGTIRLDYGRSRLGRKHEHTERQVNGHLERWLHTLRLIPFSKEKLTLLDVGAAPGTLSIITKSIFRYEVSGVDSSKLIGEAGYDFNEYVSYMKTNGITVADCNIDFEAFPFENETFDVVLFTEVIEHLHYPLHALKEIYRVLKTEGTFILSTPNIARFSNRVRALTGKPPNFHGVKEFAPQELFGLLRKADFSQVRFFFSDWSEYKYLKKLRKSHLHWISAPWIVTKYVVARLVPPLSSYMFIIAKKSHKKNSS